MYFNYDLFAGWFQRTEPDPGDRFRREHRASQRRQRKAVPPQVARAAPDASLIQAEAVARAARFARVV
jgi:hypothetical protein